jgi:hypothetical protein
MSNMGDFEMGETGQLANKNKMPAILLGLIGIILLLVGAAIITIPGAPGRGSGVGTISIVIGLVFMVLGLLRFRAK